MSLVSSFDQVIGESADWMKGGIGNQPDIVLTSRIRLARNLSHGPFPGWSTRDERAGIFAHIRPAVDSLPEFLDAFSVELSELDKIQKQVLVERHLMSLEHAARSTGCGLVLSSNQHLAVMINEEDHLRIQSIVGGLNFEEAWSSLDHLEEELDSALEFAFDDKLGYLTACPTNLGTGMRASAMLHLPGLVISEQIASVIKGVNKIGFAVRGLYGEGSEATGNLFQISNQYTLGFAEETIIEHLENVIKRIVEYEGNARAKLEEDNPLGLQDQVGRAYGTLSHARIMPSKEALNLLSLLKLGSDMNWLRIPHPGLLESLFLEIQPAHLQYAAGKELVVSERDYLRADALRERLNNIPFSVILPKSGETPPNPQQL
jgi:protein arginine kinase